MVDFDVCILIIEYIRLTFFVLVRVPWLKLRPLIARKLESVIGEFLKASPETGSVAGVNSDSVSFDEMRYRLINCVSRFNR